MTRIVIEAHVEEMISLRWTGVVNKCAIRLRFNPPQKTASGIEQHPQFRSGLFSASGEEASHLAVCEPARVIIEQK